MYILENVSLGDTLREYRKIKGMTLQDVAEKVCKSKVTICKYENNEILPDFYTLLELCNVLNLNITDFCQTAENEVDLDNPFRSKKLFVYYYTKDKLVESTVKLEKTESQYKVKFYNGMSSKNKSYGYYYEGNLINDGNYSYFDLYSQNRFANEKVQFIISVPWSESTEIYNGIYTGLTRNGLPVVKKMVISRRELNDFEKVDGNLRFSKEESKSIYKSNAFVFKNNDYDEYF